LVSAFGESAFENLKQRLCESYGAKHCILLDRARSGLFLLANLPDLKGEWLLTSLMHRPTAVLLRQFCSQLAFVDVCSDLTADIESIERVLSKRSKALVITHTYGKAARIEALRALADREGLFLVENAVHATGHTRVQGRPLGSWGDATILSFNVDKPLGAILGGALLTSREDVWRSVSSMSITTPDFSEVVDRIVATYIAYRLKPAILRTPLPLRQRNANDGVVDTESFGADSYHLYEARAIHRLQAAVALNCLSRQHIINQKRLRNAERLNTALRNISGLGLPQSEPEQPHSFTYYPLMVNGIDRLAFGHRLAHCGIETKWRYFPLHLQKGFEDVRHDDLRATEDYWQRHLLLPAGPWTRPEQIDYLADSVRLALAAS
jgi:dTDP-4-amino-4,6-dideoxygalactose transaminase